MPIVSYFITPLFPGYDRKIVLTQNDLRDTHEGLLSIIDKSYSLSTITDCYLDVADEDKGKQGLLKLSPLKNMLRIIFWGWLLSWMYDKSQTLILLGENREKIGAVDLSGFYEQDIAELISALKNRFSA